MLRFGKQWAATLRAGERGNPGISSPSLADRLLARFGTRSRPKARLSVVERVQLGPRQTLALVEAEGRLFLVAAGPESGATFHPLSAASGRNQRGMRVSW